MHEAEYKEIEELIGHHPVVVFLKGTVDEPRCGFSFRAVEILKKYTRDIVGIDVLARPDLREALPEYTDWPTFPQVFIGGKFMGGSDALAQMEDSGELKQVIAP